MTVGEEREEIARRAADARRMADAAIAALSARGIRAELIGSLARGEYGLHSDVDLLVDWADDQWATVVEACGDAFGDVEYDVVRLRGLDPDLLAQMRREAVAAVPFASVPRRMATLARSVADMTEAARVARGGWEPFYDRLEPSLRRHALTSRILRHAESTTGRMAKVLRRLLVDADGRAPHGWDWEERTIRAAALAGPGGRPALVTPADADRLADQSERVHDMAMLCDDVDAACAFASEVAEAHAAFAAAVEAALARMAPPPSPNAAARP